MYALSKVFLIGHAGKDAEVKTFDSGKKLVNINLATNDTYTAKNGEKTTVTDWHTLHFWNGKADLAEKLIKKGSFVFVEGRLKNREYKDREGNTKYSTEIDVEDFILLKNPDSSKSVDASSKKTPSKAPAEVD